MSSDIRPVVIVGNEVQLQPCTLYKHNPAAAAHCAILEEHHVCPDSWWVAAGKDPNQSPKIGLCPNCHSNTHVIIDAIIKGQTFAELPHRCRDLAWRAFDIAQANGLTPALTL